MNEIIFLIHVIVVGMFALGALRLGREALTAWSVVQALCANLFVVKQMHVFGFEVTCTDVFAIGSILGLNFLQEYHGKESAQRGVKICFFLLIFFGLMSQIHLLYTPSPHDWAHGAFGAILSPAPRLLLASLVAFLTVQKIDVGLFAVLKRRFPLWALPARNVVSLSVSQFLDTVLFSFLGLYGLVAEIGDIIFVSFVLKMLIITTLSGFTYLARRWAADV